MTLHSPVSPGLRAVTIHGRVFKYTIDPTTRENNGLELWCKHHKKCMRKLCFGARNPISESEAANRLLRWEELGATLDAAAHQYQGQSKLLTDFGSPDHGGDGGGTGGAVPETSHGAASSSDAAPPLAVIVS